jgi:hypothetical protein
MTELHAALLIVWVITLSVTYRLCLHDPMADFLRRVRSFNRRTHRKARLLSISRSLRKIK